MLLELNIRNIALAENLHIEFGRGFNVLTGETGAGKSIIVDSLNLVLGGRADRELIRNGEEKGSVQALFDISGNAAAREQVSQLGVEMDEGLICVSRELTRAGHNICRIQGTPFPLAVLKQLTSLLVDVHGQHEHQALMNPGKHMDFLDSFGTEEHQSRMENARKAYEERAKVGYQLKGLMKDASERNRLIDMLRFQVEEITEAKLKPGEEEKLESRLIMLENAEKIQSAVSSAYNLTYAGHGHTTSAQESLLGASQAMESISGLDARFERLAEQLRGLYYEVQEAGSELLALSEEVSFDSSLMGKIADRLDLISRLERKYGSSVEEVIAFGEEAKKRLESIEMSDEQILSLKKEYREKDLKVRQACEELTQSRMRLAQGLEEGIMNQLKDLGMGKTRFRVDFKKQEKPTASGMDKIEFLISPNPGEPLRPLADIASGGELSRIMLAIKALTLGKGGVDSMVFDEIDTGVSGRMAQVMGEKMLMIALKNQVLCVTHLPQIAALGDEEFLVEKTTDGERTHTNVIHLDNEGRVHELSRLVGGGSDSESSLNHARHMLSEAVETRKRLENTLR